MFGGLKERYKSFPLVIRGPLALIFGLLPAFLIYSYLIENKEEERDLALKTHDTSLASLKAAQTTAKNLPEMEKKLKFTTEQLQKSKEFLPDKYDMEAVVEKASRVAKELEITFEHFEPKKEKLIDGTYPYFEQRIELDLVGSYAQVATFYDRMANIEPNIYLKTINLARVTTGVARPGLTKEDPYDQARTLRRDQKLTAKSEIAIYRTAKSSEVKKDVKEIPKMLPISALNSAVAGDTAK